MKATAERELKLEADTQVELRRLGGDPLESRVFTSIYHDTADRRLLRAALTLRRRIENGSTVWQLKVPIGDARIEVEEPGGAVELPTLIDALLSGVLRGAELDPVATLQTHRRGRLVEGVAVTIDEVAVLDGQAVVQRFTEVEAEVVDGSIKSLDRIGRRLRKLGARPGKGRPKLQRVLNVRARPAPGRRSPSLDHLRAALLAQYDELLRYDPVVRVNDDGVEAVHRMRVAVRRLRSLLRTAKPMLDPNWVDSLREDLDWLGGRLGAVRDLDVFEQSVRADVETLGADAGRGMKLLRTVEPERLDARQQLIAAMTDERYYRLLDVVEGAAAAPPTRRANIRVDELARSEFQRLRKHAGRPSLMSDRALHKTRIRGKRARYAAELAEASRGKKATRFINVAKQLQDVLGEHQDAVVAAERLRSLARRAGKPGAAIAAGRLIEHAEHRKKHARRELPEAWRRVRRLGERTWEG